MFCVKLVEGNINGYCYKNLSFNLCDFNGISYCVTTLRVVNVRYCGVVWCVNEFTRNVIIDWYYGKR